MKYETAVERLQDLCKFGINLGLSRVEKLLEKLGSPHLKVKTVHVAGTNGKGSVTVMLASVLTACGYRTGAFTSPHLETYRERIKIDGEMISEEEFARKMEQVLSLAEEVAGETGESPTEFEVLTVLALSWFAECGVDAAVMEVGMGGRLDATNVIHPEVTVITRIGKDHSGYLGGTVREIAREKAGIIKEGVPVVTVSQHPQAMSVISKRAEEQNAVFYDTSGAVREVISSDGSGQYLNFETDDIKLENVRLNLLGEHQGENLLLALKTLYLLTESGFEINEKCLREGLAGLKWPGRLEYAEVEGKAVLLDGAHNALGVDALTRALEKSFSYDRLVLVIGILDDKDKKEMMSMLVPFADAVIITRPAGSRSFEWESLEKEAAGQKLEVILEESVAKALQTGLERTGPDDLLCVTGSLYLLGEARKILNIR